MLKNLMQKRLFWVWNHHLQTKSRIENRQLQQIANSFHSMHKFNRRQIKHSFVVWREQTKIWNKGRRVLVSILREKILYKVRQAFNKWNTFMVFTDQMMRLQTLKIGGGLTLQLQAVFQGWRQVVVRIKSRKLNRKVLVMNEWKKYIASRRYKLQ